MQSRCSALAKGSDNILNKLRSDGHMVESYAQDGGAMRARKRGAGPNVATPSFNLDSVDLDARYRLVAFWTFWHAVFASRS
jgi:hypothetical protein